MTLLTDAPSPSAVTGTVPVPVPGTVPDAVVVPVRGPLDATTAARVRDVLDAALRARPTRLVLDLGECPFVDASALAMLLEVHRRLCRTGGVLTLRGCSPRVLRLLSLTGLRRVFDLS